MQIIKFLRAFLSHVNTQLRANISRKIPVNFDAKFSQMGKIKLGRVRRAIHIQSSESFCFLAIAVSQTSKSSREKLSGYYS